MHDDLAAAVDAGFPLTRQQLEELVRIPSVSAPGFEPGEVRRSAEAVSATLADAGFSNVRLLEVDGAHPAVFGELDGPPGTPTVLLYAHHDVQPPGPSAEWVTDPFEPAERDGRLYGRGAADDKAGVVVHAAALRALEGRAPVGLKVFVEGEEEIGSLNVERFFEAYGELFEADVVVIADSGNWLPGVPSLTTSLRGLVDCIVEVRTLESAVHSGLFGGAVPDAITVLARMIASLHDESGSVAVPGLVAENADPLDMTEEMLREQTGLVEGAELIGSGAITARMWRKPSISVLAIDAPPISEAINQIVPAARAKISMRLAPGQDPAAAMAALTAHIEASVPWGAQVTVTPGASGNPVAIDTSDAASILFGEALSEAYDGSVVEIGIGGSIPIVSAFKDAYPGASVILNGVADSTSQMHGPNESVSLKDLRSAVLAEAIALRLLGESSS